MPGCSTSIRIFYFHFQILCYSTAQKNCLKANNPILIVLLVETVEVNTPFAKVGCKKVQFNRNFYRLLPLLIINSFFFKADGAHDALAGCFQFPFRNTPSILLEKFLPIKDTISVFRIFRVFIVE